MLDFGKKGEKHFVQLFLSIQTTYRVGCIDEK
jgi:hypothetical protein